MLWAKHLSLKRGERRCGRSTSVLKEEGDAASEAPQSKKEEGDAAGEAPQSKKKREMLWAKHLSLKRRGRCYGQSTSV